MALWVSLVGCESPQTPSPSPPQKPIEAAREAPDKEYWDAYFFSGEKVGHAHTIYKSLEQDGQPLLEITCDTELTIKRLGQTVRQGMRYSTWESPDGELQRFESSMTIGSADKSQGHVDGQQLVITMSNGNTVQTARIPWDRSWGGFFAVDQSLEQKPMQPGEKRQLRALMPGLNQIADVELQAVNFEQTEGLQGASDLLRIEVKIRLGKEKLEQVTWTDQRGQTMKSFMAALNQTTYRTSKENALQQNSSAFDLGERSLVKVKPPIEQPHSRQTMVYRVDMSTGNSAEVFATGATQSVRAIDEHAAEIRVRRLRPPGPLGTEFPADTPPTDDERLPNVLIQSDDEAVSKMAQQVVPSETDPWSIAMALEKHVQATVKNKDFAQAMASAAEVARSREGDCTEHAVLLAALLRARQIPARVAIGLVYSRSLGGFAYHMWTEAWIQDRWVPVDATLGLGGIGAAHLKVSHSSLKGVDPFSQFLPVLQLIGNLQVTVISQE